MNFIKVHSDNSTCLINVDNVEMLNAERGDSKVSVRFIDGTVGLGIVETVDELAALLLPGPVVVKELSPGVPERPAPQKPEPPEPEAVERAVRDLLWMVRIAVEKWHEKRYGTGYGCSECPLERVDGVKCEAFRTLKAHDINIISKAIEEEDSDFALLTFIEAVKVHKTLEEAANG